MRETPSVEAEGVHESFLALSGFRYLKIALLLCALSIGLYAWHTPAVGPNGGTWLGYTLGTAGALLILWLTLLGVRKRRYSSKLGSVKGWTSAHVYLGLSLLIIATLHCAFQFGWNVHTLAYVLMCAVIASGIYGIVMYARAPAQITANRSQGKQESWLAELDEVNEQTLKLADQIGRDVHRVLVHSVERVRVGGGLRAQLFAPKEPDRRAFEQLQQQLSETLALKTGQFTTRQLAPAEQKKPRKPTMSNPDAQSTVMFMAGQLAGMDQDAKDAERIQRLLDLIARRRDLITRINRDIRLHARMQIWLYCHVPLSFALLAALIAHIVSVFIYW
jgi:hypothetical protein